MDTTATIPEPEAQSTAPEDTALPQEPAAPEQGDGQSAEVTIPDNPEEFADFAETYFDDTQEASAPETVETESEAEQAPENAGEETQDQKEAEEEPSEPETQTEPEQLARNWRISAKDDIDARILQLHKRNPDMTLAEATAKVTGKTVQEPAASGDSTTPGKGEAEKPAEDTPETLEARRTEIKALLIKASEEFDTSPEIRKLEFELAEIPERMIAARERQAQAAAQKQQSVHSDFAKFEAQAVQLYPDAAKPDTPLYQRMAEIDADLLEYGDPLAFAADKALRIAQMAAAELAIAPVSKRSTPPAERGPKGPAAPPPVGPTNPKFRPAAGAGTGGVTPSDKLAADEALKSIRTEEDLERLLASIQ